MKPIIGIPLFLFCFLWLACLPSDSLAEKNQKDQIAQAGSPQPMVIKSDSLVVDDSKKIVIFSGRVNAKRDEFTIDCEKMFIYYQNSESARTANAIGSKITKIVADGNVKIRRKAGGEAISRHAEYYEGEDKIVLTGDPMVKQGEDFVQGDKITIFLRENRSIVESAQEKRVKAVIYPKKGTK